MIDDYKELLSGVAGEYRRDLIHAMLVYDPLNADPLNGKVPYLRSKKKRQELILPAIEEDPYGVEDWLADAYFRDFGYPYSQPDEDDAYDEEDWDDE